MSRALLTCGTMRQLPGFLGLLRSAREFHPEIDRVCYFPASELAAAREALGDLATKILAPPRDLKGVPADFQMVAARCFMATLPYDTVAYLDTDVIFTAPCPELWDVPAGMVNGVKSGDRQTVIRGVPADLQPAFRAAFPDSVGDQVVNTGVLVLNTAEWTDLAERFESTFLRGNFSHYSIWLDQPLFNVVFKDRINWMSRAYNASDLYDLGYPKDVRLMHYSGPDKPWQPGYSRIVPMYYFWLRYGVGETRPGVLWPVRARIAIWTPKRLLGQWLRKRREAREAANP